MNTTSTPPHWALSSHKGGVSKTTLTTLIAAAAADAGQRVLVVDMDPQANATRRLAARLPHDPQARSAASLAAVLTRPRPGDAGRVIVPSGWPDPYASRIDIAPAHLDLELLPATAAQPGSSRRLLTALTSVVNEYDLVLLDCPPSLRGHLVDIAWTASDVVWLPTEPEYDSIEASRRVIERVEMDRDLLNPDLEIGGLICTRYRQPLGLHQQRRIELATVLGPGGLCPWTVPELSIIKQAGEMAVPIGSLPSGAPMATLATEVYRWMCARAATVAARAS